MYPPESNVVHLYFMSKPKAGTSIKLLINRCDESNEHSHQTNGLAFFIVLN